MDTGRSVAVMSRGFLAVSTAALLGVVLLTALMSSPAKAEVVQTDRLADGAVRTTYRMGPVEVTPGQNRIAFRPVPGASRPAEDGWITRIKPDLVNLDGSIPDSSKVMFHHGVWINQTGGQQELFYATGEEKTILAIPEGFGYRYRKNDVWILNDMIHNLTPQPMELYFEYTIDMIPATAPQAADTVRARPIWMDVENGIYPVFDVWRDSGGADGEFTFPEDASNPYPGGFEKNVKVVPQNGVLLNTTGHVHTGGLSTNLYLRREGASWNGETCPERISFDDELIPLRERDLTLAARLKRAKSKDTKLKAKLKKAKRNLKKAKTKAKKKAKRSLKTVQRKRKASAKSLSKARKAKASNAASLRQVEAKDRAERARDEACWSDKPRVDKGNRVQLFDSKAKYFDPRGPISWDMAMFSTDQDWRVRVKQGDLLELQTTYETEIASWPESMGINVVYWSTDGDINAIAGQPDPANAPRSVRDQG